ncbi:SDR family NAD(P)-dependent oxidoreductase [uncultured Maritimibacter sp.]|jgi:NAD(P)-dependent dehydrogenase (short-subunit alcohol dehydrogenase family)|uniref:SDR family NAD(P)-dependent oxidoreductase n=1 Tax=uncultured Maritimibacter sp. TaxID=991866 RepID=UPI000AD190E1|nr:SDR family oxidoreductase [uncultured Maritimibacter sp.]
MTHSLFDLAGKTALVTGSTRGIGKAIAMAYAEAGANVVISSRKVDACDAVADEINARGGGRATPIAANIAEDADIDRLVSEAEKQVGAVDILVCNAAVNPYMGPFLDTPDDAFDKTIAVNIRSNMRLCRAVVPGMQARRDGAIVIISSIAAFKGSKNLGIYAVTKAADAQIVRNLATAYGRDNIRVNGIAPAVVKTKFASALYEDPEREKAIARSYSLKRLGEPDDIAGAALYFGSRAGAWTTGQTLIIDGGWSIEESL